MRGGGTGVVGKGFEEEYQAAEDGLQHFIHRCTLELDGVPKSICSTVWHHVFRIDIFPEVSGVSHVFNQTPRI